MTVSPKDNPYPVGPNGPVYLTTAEVAERFRTAELTVRYWRRRGEGPLGVQFQGRVLYPLPAIEAWEAAQIEASRQERQQRAASRRPCSLVVTERDEAIQRAGQLIAEAIALIVDGMRPPPAPATPADSDAVPARAYLTTSEVAEKLGVAPGSLSGWQSTGTGPPCVKFDGRVMYPVDELQSWETEQRAAEATEQRRRGSGFIHDRTNRNQKL